MKNGCPTLLPLLAGLSLLVLLGCNRKPSDDEGESGPAPVPRVPVAVAPVTRGTAVLTVAATGHVEALRREKVLSPVAGKIISLNALEGTSFKQGDVMAVVQPKETQSAIAGAEALLRSAKTPAQAEEARRALALAESVQNSVEIRAKFNGVIGSRDVAEGELVADNTEMFTLLDLSSLVFQADVPVAALPNVHPGEHAEIQCTGLPAAFSFPGTVDALSPQSDPQSQTVRARIRIDARGGSMRSLLRSEMPGTAHIVTGVRPHALLIPRSALLRNDENNTYSVVTVTPDSLALSVPVTVGVMTDSTAEITGGNLQQGTIVVKEGNYSLADSTKVAVGAQSAP